MHKHFLEVSPYTSVLPTVLIIPTGIRCSVGGYAGDAIPAARLLASVSGCLITHPNVMNGAALYWNEPRIQYVEGLSLDRFVAGDLALRPVRQQQIGLLLDAGLDTDLQQRHLQVIDACRASLGLRIGPVVITDNPLEITLNYGSSGSSWGEVGNVNDLLTAGESLKRQGATAIAVVTRFPEGSDLEALEKYRQGTGVDASAGAEAVISHLLVSHLCLPCAHAPAMSGLPINVDLDPRAAAEELGHTFLPSVLVGLSRAPDLLTIDERHLLLKNGCYNYLTVQDLGAVVAPQEALGGAAVLACLEKNLPLIVVANPSLLSVSKESLGIQDELHKNDDVRILKATNYVEAAGLLGLLREGISVESLYRPIASVNMP